MLLYVVLITPSCYFCLHTYAVCSETVCSLLLLFVWMNYSSVQVFIWTCACLCSHTGGAAGGGFGGAVWFVSYNNLFQAPVGSEFYFNKQQQTSWGWKPPLLMLNVRTSKAGVSGRTLLFGLHFDKCVFFTDSFKTSLRVAFFFPQTSDNKAHSFLISRMTSVCCAIAPISAFGIWYLLFFIE